MNSTILILGACGQIGTELTLTLRAKYGNDAVIATDIREPEMKELKNGPFELLDASDGVAMRSICEKYSVHTMYHLVAMLSATGEKFPMKAWDLNMQSLLHALELAREGVLSKIFWPSSIAVLVQQLLIKTHHNKPSWSLRRCMEFQNLRENVGANIMLLNTVLTFVPLDIPD